MLVAGRWVADTPRSARRPTLDLVGAVLSALGLFVVVVGLLMSSTWGWLVPVNSPVTPFGYSLTPFAVALGWSSQYGFALWEVHRGAAARIRWSGCRCSASRP